MTARSSGRTPPWQRGFLGHYALSVLGQGPVYAHQLSAQIAARTQGAWSPSPGAIYPAFRSLEARGLVRAERRDGRRIYFITAAGRRHLAQVREARGRWGERFGGSWRLMLDIIGPERRAETGLRRLRQALEMSEALVGGEEELLTASERAALRRSVMAELRGSLRRLGTGGRRS